MILAPSFLWSVNGLLLFCSPWKQQVIFFLQYCRRPLENQTASRVVAPALIQRPWFLISPPAPSTSDPPVWCLPPPAGMRLRGGRELTPDPYLELVAPPPRVAWLSGVLRKGVRLRLRLNHGDSDQGRSFWQLVDLGADPERTRPRPSKVLFFCGSWCFLRRRGLRFSVGRLSIC